MKKILGILIFMPLLGFGQNVILKNEQGKVVFSNGNIIIVKDTLTVTVVGDGVIIGDGIKVGDDIITENLIKMPEQYMKKEETLNELMS